MCSQADRVDGRKQGKRVDNCAMLISHNFDMLVRYTMD